jgi:hypothetical protein
MSDRIDWPFPSPGAFRAALRVATTRVCQPTAERIPDGTDPVLHLLIRRSLRPGQLILAAFYPLITVGVVSLLPPILPALHLYCVLWWSTVSIAAVWPVLDHLFDELRRLKSSGTLREMVMAGIDGRRLGDALTAAPMVLLLIPMSLVLVAAPFATEHFAPKYGGPLGILYATFHRLQWLAIPYSVSLMVLAGTTAWWTVLCSNERGARGWFTSLVRTATFGAGCHLICLPMTMLVLRALFPAMKEWRVEEQVVLGLSANVAPATLAIVAVAATQARRALEAWPVAVASGQFEEGD